MKFIKSTALLATAFLWTAPSVAESPRVFSLEPQRLEAGRKRAQENDPRVRAAVRKLKREADAALRAGPFSVLDKSLTPPSGDKHDYMTFGPYWWPDPSKPDGLPYIRRDGEVNPESREGTDGRAFSGMVSAVRTLSLAYYFIGEERYAERAALLLRTWFLDEKTRMNPHLKYGQGIPGRTEGRGTGTIGTSRLPAVVDGVGLIQSSPAWTEENQQEWSTG